MTYGAAFIAGFILGSIPFGFIMVKVLRGTDIREHGSGNIGATNVIRLVGRVPGICVFLLDVLKGLLPALIFKLMFNSNAGISAGVGAIAGHMFTPFLKFRGGKGVATSLGVFIGLAPIASAVAFGVWLILFLSLRWVSLASVSAAISLPVFLYLSRSIAFSEFSLGLLIFALAATLVVISRHSANIKRLCRGKEPKFCWGKKPQKGRG